MDIQQARNLAQDETTAPEILAKLVTNQDYQTRKYVASNPNTPTEILLSICFEFPTEVMNNSVIPLLVLENPYLLTCKIPLDFNQIVQLTDLEIKRLGWTTKQARKHLIQNYRKPSRLRLTDKEILSYLAKLRQIR